MASARIDSKRGLFHPFANFDVASLRTGCAWQGFGRSRIVQRTPLVTARRKLPQGKLANLIRVDGKLELFCKVCNTMKAAIG